MIDRDKEVLRQLSKDQLIYLIEQFERSNSLISEVCVDVSKLHIRPDKAIDEIRDYIYSMPDLYDVTELKTFIDMKMNKISIEECRKIIGLE